ncbi:putative quinol monooxygenase [Mucilaginibacter pedocola]|uniref:Antibiotic biosynthesis monooxygenase n=1 Tax=Mucilaginibacter pedocola TaxID=1792845 RepID=A0A1S9P749_9SPHI|nr:putative quinol monooxygenase [Mucilaginibacter pedocola]OOQ56774.1 antibiotic biosynthesis monooxygenase [Mucilaginibacter pedocola]
MENTAIHVIAKWIVKPGELQTVLGLLPVVVKATRAEPGNLFYHVQQDDTDPNTLLLFEGYMNESAAAQHRNSEHYQSIVAGQIVPLLQAREVNITTPLFF